MAGAKPPEGIPPERLFRKLLEMPRASTGIAWRSAGLRVRALTQLEEAACYDEAASVESPEVRWSLVSRGLVAAAAFLPGGESAFANADAVGQLPGVHADALGLEVRAALARISPSHLRSDQEAWRAALIAGAKHWSNAAITSLLGSCVDISNGYSVRTTIERPDRFFGVPLHALTDGQRMAYRAARAVLIEAQNAA